MPKWTDYKSEARERGSLAFELFIIQSTPAEPPETIRKYLPAHLAYQSEMEKAGKLFLAGPLSDESGEEMSGAGLIIYRAGSMQEARSLAAADPMHDKGGRTFTVRRWLVNEGTVSIRIGLSTRDVKLT